MWTDDSKHLPLLYSPPQTLTPQIRVYSGSWWYQLLLWTRTGGELWRAAVRRGTVLPELRNLRTGSQQRTTSSAAVFATTNPNLVTAVLATRPLLYLNGCYE
ncbi:unnamed protein product [Sphacelaria rigidula]